MCVNLKKPSRASEISEIFVHQVYQWIAPPENLSEIPETQIIIDSRYQDFGAQ